MREYLKYIAIAIVVILCIILLKVLIKPNIDKQLKEYLVEKGFNASEYENLYIKNEDNKKKSFSLGDYTYMLEVIEDTGGMVTTLNATYDFKKEKIIYSYRVRYSNSVNVYFKGIYDDENFTCEKEFSAVTLNDNEKENACNLAKYHLNIFNLEAKSFFDQYMYIEYIKNK